MEKQKLHFNVRIENVSDKKIELVDIFNMSNLDNKDLIFKSNFIKKESIIDESEDISEKAYKNLLLFLGSKEFSVYKTDSIEQIYKMSNNEEQLCCDTIIKTKNKTYNVKHEIYLHQNQRIAINTWVRNYIKDGIKFNYPETKVLVENMLPKTSLYIGFYFHV